MELIGVLDQVVQFLLSIRKRDIDVGLGADRAVSWRAPQEVLDGEVLPPWLVDSTE
jgi:hypothetical protein